MSTSEEATKLTPVQAMDILGLTMVDLVAQTGLSMGSVRHAVMGGSKFNLRHDTVSLVARALEMEPCDIIWPSRLSDKGRMPLTGGKYTVTEPIPVQPTCTECFTVLPVSGQCSHCAA